MELSWDSSEMKIQIISSPRVQLSELTIVIIDLGTQLA